jgi:hypothetical protein
LSSLSIKATEGMKSVTLLTVFKRSFPSFLFSSHFLSQAFSQVKKKKKKTKDEWGKNKQIA